MEVVYAQKLLNSDLHHLTCDRFKEKNDKYLGCEDGWVLKERHFRDEDRDDDDDDDDGDDRHHRLKKKNPDEGTKLGFETETKFRQVWIQGFVVEYIESKDWLMVRAS